MPRVRARNLGVDAICAASIRTSLKRHDLIDLMYLFEA